MIVLNELSKEWNGRLVLDGISLTIFAAEKVALLGRRASGKSTLIEILCGYLRPSTGSVQVGPFDLGRHSSRARHLIGYIPTHPPVYPDLTTEQYLKLCAELRGLSPQQTAIDPVLELCRLEEYRRQLIGQLSRGEQQRINLAQALLHHPSLLLIDDPFVDLDPAERDTLLDILLSFGPQRTLLLATHNLDLVPRLCNRTIILHRGRVNFDGEIKDLQAFPHLTAAFSHYTPDQEISYARDLGPLEA